MATGLALLTLPDELLAHPAHVLRGTAREVGEEEFGSPRLTALARAMLVAMYDAPGGVGLAAPMLGVSARVVVMDVDEQPLVLINPTLVAQSGAVDHDTEANLCLPQRSAVVERATSIIVRFRDLRGRYCQLTADGWMARVVLHELELLDGKLFLDGLDDGGIAAGPARQGASSLSLATLTPDLLSLESSVLRRPAAPVDFAELGSERLQWLVREMFILQHLMGGLGLAAPQVGMSLRLAVIDDGESTPVILLNPRLLERSGEEEDDFEGCLSIPGFEGLVSRAQRIKVLTHTLAGTPMVLDAEGDLARVIQHELDHLDGVLYPDRMAAGEELEPVDGDTLAERALHTLLADDPGQAQAA